MQIWHNPRCSTCRTTLSLLEERGQRPEVRRYLDDPPSAAELDDALSRLGLEPWEITRMREARAEELGIAEMDHDRDAWIGILAANPILIQRPIVLADGGRAIVARPPERVLELLED